MSFHLLTYQQTVNASSYTQVNSITDPAVTTTSNRYLLPNDRQALFACALGASLKRARITSPSIASNFAPNIRPTIQASTIASDPSIAILLESPLRLPAREGIEFDVVNGGSEATYCAIGATEQVVPAARGEIRVLHGTATTTLTTNSYTTLSVTWDNNLQKGIYDVVSAEVFSTGGIFFRLLFTGQTDRPGGLCIQSLANRSNMYFTSRFALGQWGSFNEVQLPQVEVMSTSADTSEEVFLYLVKRS